MPELPRDFAPALAPATLAEVERIAVRLDGAATECLLKHSVAAYRTRPQELMLAALARALCDTFEQQAVGVLLEGHGREDLFEDVDVSRTVGWFTTEYPVVLAPEPDVAGTIVAVKERLRSVPAHGSGTACWRGSAPSRSAGSSPGNQPRVVFNYLVSRRGVRRGSLFRVAGQGGGAEAAASTPLTSWLEINGQVYAGELTLWIGFSPSIYRRATVERLATRFERSLSELIAHCTTPGTGALTPSDFPLARLDRSQLAALAPIEDLYPVTPMQHGILFHALYDQEPGVYVTQLAVTIEGLDPARFAAAWSRALARHPILRTSFVWEGVPEPLQRVSADVQLALERLDLRAERDSESALERIVQEQHREASTSSGAALARRARAAGRRAPSFIWTHQPAARRMEHGAVLDECCSTTRSRPPMRAPVRRLCRLARAARSRREEAFWRERLRAWASRRCSRATCGRARVEVGRK